MLDPEKRPFLCLKRREYRQTTLGDINFSKADKRRGGGPRVGPFQACIPGSGWRALPKYDFTTKNRSTAFNERMHVEWENHVDHILANDGELPVASVVAKAGFRSCAPCCRDMLALARPTGKCFIMVDLAEDDQRGTFHFVTGEKYLPVPKEACAPREVAALKSIVLDAQAGAYQSIQAIHDAVLDLGVPVDEEAQAMYLGDQALLPSGCASDLKGRELLEVLHAEHFARLPAEYGASILRDPKRSAAERNAVLRCRNLAKQTLVAAWSLPLAGLKIDLEAYANAAAMPLLPEVPQAYQQARFSLHVPRSVEPRVRLTQSAGKPWRGRSALLGPPKPSKDAEDDNASVAEASTAVPEDNASSCADLEDPDDTGAVSM